MKGWYADAIDILNNALESYELKDSAMGKELRYNLARAYEENGNTQEALDIFRKIAQSDFAYKDVSQRVNNLRNKINRTTFSMRIRENIVFLGEQSGTFFIRQKKE